MKIIQQILFEAGGTIKGDELFFKYNQFGANASKEEFKDVLRDLVGKDVIVLDESTSDISLVSGVDISSVADTTTNDKINLFESDTSDGGHILEELADSNDGIVTSEDVFGARPKIREV